MNSFARLGGMAIVATTLLTANSAFAVTVNSFQFNGALTVDAASGTDPATVNFLPTFTIRSQNGSVAGDLIGLEGNIAGDYTFADPGGANSIVLTSPTGPNSFTISDGIETFAATVDLIELQGGGGGTIFGRIDFGTSSYAGVNPGLIALNNLIQEGPNLTITFQTLGGSGVDLDDLFLNGSSTDGLGNVATYSAAVRIARSVNVAEPAPLALLGFGLLASAAWARRRRVAV